MASPSDVYENVPALARLIINKWVFSFFKFGIISFSLKYVNFNVLMSIVTNTFISTWMQAIRKSWTKDNKPIISNSMSEPTHEKQL